ncbi:hypothetical protein ACW9HQ_42760, partial [Nocardia gipuzkoensis]
MGEVDERFEQQRVSSELYCGTDDYEVVPSGPQSVADRVGGVADVDHTGVDRVSGVTAGEFGRIIRRQLEPDSVSGCACRRRQVVVSKGSSMIRSQQNRIMMQDPLFENTQTRAGIGTRTRAQQPTDAVQGR